MFNVQIEPTIVKTWSGVSRGSMLGVDPSGAFLTMDMSKLGTIQQIQVNQIGTGVYTFELFSDNAKITPIFQAVTDNSGILYLSRMCLEYQNTDNPQQSKVYVKITPQVGSGHQYAIAIFFDKK